jgi:hypothetical protein
MTTRNIPVGARVVSATTAQTGTVVRNIVGFGFAAPSTSAYYVTVDWDRRWNTTVEQVTDVTVINQPERG